MNATRVLRELRRLDSLLHIVEPFQFHRFLHIYIYASTANLQIRKTRVEQHLPDWANWLVLYPPWICCRDCTKLPPFSHSTIPLARVMRSRIYSGKHIHMYTRYFKIDEYFSLSYRFRDKFKAEFFLFGNFLNGLFTSSFFVSNINVSNRKHSCIIK